jgi:hypothetical protein
MSRINPKIKTFEAFDDFLTGIFSVLRTNDNMTLESDFQA